jgi:hypothetical protein
MLNREIKRIWIDEKSNRETKFTFEVSFFLSKTFEVSMQMGIQFI